MKKGFGLLAVVFIILVFSVLAIGFVSFILSESDLSVKKYRYTRAFYVAEAGRNFAIKHISSYPDWSGDVGLPLTESFGDGTFTISVANVSPDQVDLSAMALVTAEGKTYSRTLMATVTSGEGISVSDWQEVY